jgi:hypothetical protein
MSRGRPDHGRRNPPFSAGLRHRWWCDLVLRKRRQDREEITVEVATGGKKRHKRGGPANAGTHAKVPEA